MSADRVRIQLTDEGPLLLYGPAEIELPDGRVVHPARPVTALCTCRRSRRPPFCDTSHRAKRRPNRTGGAPDAD